MHYVLFFPDRDRITDQHLTDVGLGSLCRSGGPDWWEDRFPGDASYQMPRPLTGASTGEYASGTPLGTPNTPPAIFDESVDPAAAAAIAGVRGMCCTWRRGQIELDPPFNLQAGWKWWLVGGGEGESGRGGDGETEESHPITTSPPHTISSYWIGINPTQPPGPDDLQRPTVRRGTAVELGDGRHWIVPSAYWLPATNGVDLATKKFGRQFHPEFREYCEQAGRYAMEVFSRAEDIKMLASTYGTPAALGHKAANVSIPLEDAWGHCCRALDINYRLTPELATVLGLLNDASVIRVCAASFDFPLIEEALKKNELPSPIGIPVGSIM